MQEIFDSYIENSFGEFNQAEFKFKQFEVNYKKYFPNKENASVLDIGIGRGEMLTCMKNWGYDYLGVDISPSTVGFCKSIKLNCELTDNTTNWLKEREGEFELITCLDVLEHIPKEYVIEFLISMRKALKENGTLIIQVPNLQSPFGYLHHFNDFTHVNGFVEHSLAQVLITAGFDKFTFWGFEELYQKNIKVKIRKILRVALQKAVRFARAINCNPNPKILDPVLYAIIKK